MAENTVAEFKADYQTWKRSLPSEIWKQNSNDKLMSFWKSNIQGKKFADVAKIVNFPDTQFKMLKDSGVSVKGFDPIVKNAAGQEVKEVKGFGMDTLTDPEANVDLLKSKMFGSRSDVVPAGAVIDNSSVMGLQNMPAPGKPTQAELAAQRRAIVAAKATPNDAGMFGSALATDADLETQRLKVGNARNTTGYGNSVTGEFGRGVRGTEFTDVSNAQLNDLLAENTRMLGADVLTEANKRELDQRRSEYITELKNRSPDAYPSNADIAASDVYNSGGITANNLAAGQYVKDNAAATLDPAPASAYKPENSFMAGLKPPTGNDAITDWSNMGNAAPAATQVTNPTVAQPIAPAVVPSTIGGTPTSTPTSTPAFAPTPSVDWANVGNGAGTQGFNAMQTNSPDWTGFNIDNQQGYDMLSANMGGPIEGGPKQGWWGKTKDWATTGDKQGVSRWEKMFGGTDDKGNRIYGGVGRTLGLATGLANTWIGMENLQLAKDQHQTSKDQWQANYDQQMIDVKDARKQRAALGQA